MSIVIARNLTWRSAVVLFAAATLLFGGSSALAQSPTGNAAAPKMKGVWEPVNYGEDLSLVDVLFVTPEIGYVAGEAGTILKTTDAGASWTPLLGGDPESQERAVKQLWFVTPTIGWAAQTTSSTTHLLRTTDGDLWTRIGELPEHYDDFAFATETEGVFVNDRQIFRTQDAGKTWTEVFQCAARADVGGLARQIHCNLWKMRFASTSVVYALGQAIEVDAAVIVKSTDGGASWSVVHVLENESGSEGGLFFIDENVGYFSTRDAKSAFRTTDGGLTWTGMPATSIGRRIVFADPGVGWAMRYNMLSYTTDGGKRWSSRQLALPAMPNAFSLPRRDRAYVVGDHGMIYRYSVVPESAPVAARAVAAPAMPGLDNAVLAQIAQLESRLDKIDAAVEAAGGAAGAGAAAGGDWSSAAVDQQLAQMQSTIDTVASGVPTMGSKHRNLNLVMLGLQLLGDLTGQGNGLKEAFTNLRQSQDLGSASTALQSLHGTLDSMKTSVESFQTARKPAG
jgi:photosystem II stability/assembly factor-like uncharacterized protein